MELVFECAGSTFTANQAVQIVARGGKIMMVGTQSKPVPIDFLKINREVTIQTSFVTATIILRQLKQSEAVSLM